MQLSILRRARFGRSSEKLDREIEREAKRLVEEDERLMEIATAAALFQEDCVRAAKYRLGQIGLTFAIAMGLGAIQFGLLFMGLATAGAGVSPATGSSVAMRYTSASGRSVPSPAAARSRAMPRTPMQSCRFGVIDMSNTGSLP